MPMQLIDRRRFLELGIAAGAGVAATSVAGVGGVAAGNIGPGIWTSDGGAPAAPAPVAQRQLVVIDMAGGNDGLSMVPPIGSSAYHTLRPRTALADSAMLPLSASVGLHPALVKMHARGIAAVQGVGLTKPDLSHFESLRRWWAGDRTSTTITTTGFLGRLCDEIGDPTVPAVGVSLGYGPSPALVSANVSTLSMEPYSNGGFPRFWNVEMDQAWTAGWRTMCELTDPNAPVPFRSARKGGAYALAFAEDVAANLPPGAAGYPQTDLGTQLGLAARLLASNEGVRVVHVPFFGDFDTHDDHLARHARLMAQLDAALDRFLDDLVTRGISNRVIVATTSEFGRRVPDNASNGLDHGAASFAFIAGAPVTAGLFGTYPNLNSLDSDDDLKATVDLWDYYATLGEAWLGVPASSVLGAGATPIPGVIA
jgi:uncharacterized protein (DUF1501 family)